MNGTNCGYIRSLVPAEPIVVFPLNRYGRLAGKLAGGEDGAAFPHADRALFQAINSGSDAAEQARRCVKSKYFVEFLKPFQC